MQLTHERTGSPVVTAYRDVLLFGSVVRSASDCGDLETFRERALSLILEADLAAERAGVAKDDIAAARFAAAAYVDEMVLNSNWQAKEDWSSHPLQYELFGTHEAGVEFFRRLEAMRKGRASNQDLLELYYLCLALGFEGQYTLAGREKRQTLIREIARELGNGRGGVPELSPHGRRPDELTHAAKRNRLPWVVCGASLALVLVCFVVLTLRLGSLTENVVDELTTTKLRVEQTAR